MDQDASGGFWAYKSGEHVLHELGPAVSDPHPALAELLLSRRNLAYKPAAHGELDPIGMTQRLVEDSLEGKKGVVSPVQHAKSLKRINRGYVVFACLRSPRKAPVLRVDDDNQIAMSL